MNQQTTFLRIESLPPKNLVGMSLETSFMHDQTARLWQSFMPRRNEIEHPSGSDLISLADYPTGFFHTFDAARSFRRWALQEVTHIDALPAGFDILPFVGGLYAVFLHRGSHLEAASTFRFIFETWLPQSAYTLDDRPHFEVIGDRYKHGSPESEEEIYIPVRL